MKLTELNDNHDANYEPVKWVVLSIIAAIVTKKKQNHTSPIWGGYIFDSPFWLLLKSQNYRSMSSFTVADLYDEYTEKRRLNLTFEQFTAFVTFYPALLIAHTDGAVDEKEWRLLRTLANGLVSLSVRKGAGPDEIEDLQLLFFKEFQYLVAHFDAWERKFIKTLRRHLHNKPEEKEAVLKVIYLLADASDGICEKESIMIEHLTKELGIETCKI